MSKMRIGILAYGSIITDPGYEIENSTIERRTVLTPFRVEFARKSKKRDDAPTLIPVEEGGSYCEAKLLVLKENTGLNYAKDILYRREIGQVGNTNRHYNPDPSNENQVYVEPLLNAFEMDYVLYTKIKANIDNLTPENLADLAIESAKKDVGKNRKDGIIYLKEMKENNIHTVLSDDYENEIKKKMTALTLEEAWKNVRKECV